MDIITFNSPLGDLWLGADDKYILRVSYRPLTGVQKETRLLKQAKQEITEYLDGKRQIFTVPFKFEGTPFQMKVWQTLLTIPYGKVWRYVEVADILGDMKKSRAVGGACRINPLPILVPCHRVVGVADTGGYTGGVINKKKLINLETISSL